MLNEDLFGTDSAIEELRRNDQRRREKIGRKTRAGWKIALVVFGFCAFGGVGTIAIVKFTSYRALAHELELAKRDGIPLEPSDLKGPPVHESENAAPLYKTAIGLLANKKSPYTLLAHYISGKAKPSELKLLAKLDPVWIEAGRIAEIASNRPRCYFQRDWSKGLDLVFPEYPDLKLLGQLECVKAMQASNPQEAVRYLAVAERIGNHLASEPIIIAMLSGMSMRTAVLSAAGQIAKKHAKDAGMLEALQSFIGKLGPVPAIKDHLRAEIVSGRTALRVIPQMQSDEAHRYFGVDDAGIRLLRIGWLADAFEANYIHFYRVLITNLPSDGNDWRKEQQVMEAQDRAIMADQTIAGTFTRMSAPVFGGSTVQVGRYFATRNLTQTLVALLQERLSNGAIPKSLPKAAFTADPFSTKALIYKPSKTGFVVYSVDQDGHDDGGKVDTTGPNRDIVLTYP